MKIINEALKAKDIKFDALPEELKADINNLKEMIVKYNMACDSYEATEKEDKPTEAKLDETADLISESEKGLAERINAIQSPAEAAAAQKADEEAAAKKKADDETAAARAEEEKRKVAAVPKKEDTSVGWLIFGAIALVATLGAVNLLKKR